MKNAIEESKSSLASNIEELEKSSVARVFSLETTVSKYHEQILNNANNLTVQENNIKKLSETVSNNSKEIIDLHLELGHGSVDEKEGLVDTIAESGELE